TYKDILYLVVSKSSSSIISGLIVSTFDVNSDVDSMSFNPVDVIIATTDSFSSISPFSLNFEIATNGVKEAASANIPSLDESNFCIFIVSESFDTSANPFDSLKAVSPWKVPLLVAIENDLDFIDSKFRETGFNSLFANDSL